MDDAQFKEICVGLTIAARGHLANRPTGKWSRDCETGESLAVGLLAEMSRTEDPTLLGDVVHALVTKKRFSGVEVGFFHRLALTMMKGNEADYQHYLSVTSGLLSAADQSQPASGQP